jgi:thiamine-phosphate pyrophosphorylase
MEQSVYRIIDANFNRGREAFRVIEEYCRFVLNSSLLTGRAKQLRHAFCGIIEKMDAGLLIASRDTEGDVGVGKKVDGQLSRCDLNSCFTAACKRISEALRVLEEVIKTIDADKAAAIEKLRYQSYTLEKDIVLASDGARKFKNVRLYIVISSESTDEVVRLSKACIEGGADCIQLRAKNIEDDRLFDLGCKFVEACKGSNVITIINDRIDMALACGADGVHFGQNDLPIDKARKLCPRPLIIGKSTHSVQQLQYACGESVNYVGVGPVFATPTKPTVQPVSLDYVRDAAKILADTAIKGVAIGGLDINNVEQVLKTGANVIAVCSAVTKAKDPQRACKSLKEKIDAFFLKLQNEK